MGNPVADFATQYVDEKIEMLTDASATSNREGVMNRDLIFAQANNNTKAWPDLMWISGGNLNPGKCFFYYIKPKYNFKNSPLIIVLYGNLKERYYSMTHPPARPPHLPDMNPTQNTH
jgi:hypothetical protein